MGTEFNGLCELRYRLHKLGDAGVVLSSCSPRGETVVLEALVGFVGVLIVRDDAGGTDDGKIDCNNDNST